MCNVIQTALVCFNPPLIYYGFLPFSFSGRTLGPLGDGLGPGVCWALWGFSAMQACVLLPGGNSDPGMDPEAFLGSLE